LLGIEIADVILSELVDLVAGTPRGYEVGGHSYEVEVRL